MSCACYLLQPFPTIGRNIFPPPPPLPPISKRLTQSKAYLYPHLLQTNSSRRHTSPLPRAAGFGLASLSRPCSPSPSHRASSVPSPAAYLHTRRISAGTLLTFVFAHRAVIAWLNIANDVFDSDNGIDVQKKESVVNILDAWKIVRNDLLLLVLLFQKAPVAALSSRPELSESRDADGVAILSLELFGGYAYPDPPSRWATTASASRSASPTVSSPS